MSASRLVTAARAANRCRAMPDQRAGRVYVRTAAVLAVPARPGPCDGGTRRPPRDVISCGVAVSENGTLTGKNRWQLRRRCRGGHSRLAGEWHCQQVLRPLR
jgi:hypothetical protein